MPLCQPVILLKQSQRCATWDGKNYSSSPKNALPRLFSWDAQAMMQSDASCSFTISCRDSKRSVQKVSKKSWAEIPENLVAGFPSISVEPGHPPWEFLLALLGCVSISNFFFFSVTNTKDTGAQYVLLIAVLGNLPQPFCMVVGINFWKGQNDLIILLIAWISACAEG